MFYPHRPDYKCPDCGGNMKWQAEIYGSFYNIGRHYCDNPDCINHKNNYFNIEFMKRKLDKKDFTTSS